MCQPSYSNTCFGYNFKHIVPMFYTTDSGQKNVTISTTITTNRGTTDVNIATTWT